MVFSNTDDIETVIITTSIISAALSFSVLLTAIMFPEMRKKMFMQIIIMLSLCDFAASVGSALGFPTDNSLLCPAQGVITTFFYRASWFWSVILNYQLYGVVMSGKLLLTPLKMHGICWTVALLITIMPFFAKASYGREDDYDNGWCFIYVSSDYTFLILYSSMVLAPLIVSISMLFYFSFRLFWKFLNIDTKILSPPIYEVLDMLRLYPVAMTINWLPNLVVSFIVDFIPPQNHSVWNIVLSAATILATQNGTFSALIFFIKSKEARCRWRHLLGLQPTTEESLASIPIDFEDEYNFTDDEQHEEGFNYFRYSDQSAPPVPQSVKSSMSSNDYTGWSIFGGNVNSPFQQPLHSTETAREERFSQIQLVTET